MSSDEPVPQAEGSQTLKEIAQEVHLLAQAKGWHNTGEPEDAFVERTCNNLHDEVSELHQAWRNNQLHAPCDKEGLALSYLEEELADIVIRALDSAEKLGVDIQHAVQAKHEYNKSRTHRHGGKKS